MLRCSQFLVTLDAGVSEDPSSPPLPERTPESLVLASEQSEFHCTVLVSQKS